MLDQPVPNPLAKNPNVHTHKVFATVGLILIGVILAIAGIWYYVEGQSGTTDTALDETTTTKVSTSSAKADKKDETADWETYTNDTYKFSFKYPTGWTEKGIINSNYILFQKGSEQLRFFLVDPGIQESSIFETLQVDGKETTFLTWVYKYEFNTGETLNPEKRAVYSAYGTAPGIKPLQVSGSFYSVVYDSPTASFDMGWAEAKKIVATINFL